jgi:hypothetical protein
VAGRVIEEEETSEGEDDGNRRGIKQPAPLMNIDLRSLLSQV